MRFFWDNKADLSGDIQRSSAADGFPEENLINEDPNKVWRTTGDAGSPGEAVQIDMGSAQSIAAFILQNHDILAADSSLAVAANTSDSWGSPPFSEAITYTASQLFKVWSPASYRWWQFSWTKNVATTVYNLGRIFLGPYTETTIQPDYRGFNRSIKDLSVNHTTTSGHVYSLQRAKPRKFDLVFHDLPLGELETYVDGVGTHKAHWIQVDPNASGELAEIIYVKLVREPEFRASSCDGQVNFDLSLEFQEIP